MFDDDFGLDRTVPDARIPALDLARSTAATTAHAVVPVRPASLTETREIEIPQWAIDSTR
jgi:hypothetical protein